MEQDPEIWDTPTTKIALERLVQAVDRAYQRPGLLIWRSFVQGFSSAVGAWVGSAIILAGSGFLIQRFDLIRPIVEGVQHFITDTVVRPQTQLLNGIYDGASENLPTLQQNRR